MVSATTNLVKFSEGQPNLEVSVLPVAFIGLEVYGGITKDDDREGAFNHEFSGTTYGGSLKLYPFGAPRLYDLAEFMRFGYRSGGSFGDSWISRYLNGVYLGAGYEISSGEMTIVPDESLNSPWSSFDYLIEDEGITLQLGYNLVLSHFMVDIGYRFRFANYSATGPIDGVIQGPNGGNDSAYLDKPVLGSLRVSVGVAF